MNESGEGRGQWRKPILAIDKFTVEDAYVQEALLLAGMSLGFGESFLPFFLSNIHNHLDNVEVRAGDILRVGKLKDDLEILVLDCAKTAGLNAFVITNWFPKLIPGLSLVIQQDFYTPAQPWIAVTMAMLSEYFELQCEKIGESAIFKLTRSIPANVLQEVATTPIRSRRSVDALSHLIEQLTPSASTPLRLSKALLLNSMGDVRAAKSELSSVVTQEVSPNDEKWSKWLALAIISIEARTFGSPGAVLEAYTEHGASRFGGEFSDVALRT